MNPSRVDELLAELEPLGVRLELAEFRRLLAALGAPERTLPCVLVAGTNGKGTVSALLAAIATAASLRSGLYTSPHLERWEERIRIDDELIDGEELAEQIHTILSAAKEAGLSPPTVFEVLTTAAFRHFTAKDVDLAILEVGLGGRLDATNVVTPLISVVTRIALDHREWLGDDLPSIAREKAGILRPATPALIAPQLPESDAALAEVARAVGAEMVRSSEMVTLDEVEWRGLDGHRVSLRTTRERLELDLRLAGEHQLDNLGAAVATAELLSRRFPSIDGEAIARGVTAVRWPGRLERFEIESQGVTALLDVAHNPDGCQALARFLARLDRPYVLLFGALADKQVEAMLPPLTAAARAIVLTRAHSPRALAPEQQVSHLGRALPAGLLRCVEDPVAAVAVALEACGRTGADLIVACGSTYLAGAVRHELRRRTGA